ncbi:MAG TPA: hypothetical protein VHC96_14750, partial [Puia sp.]|nr:hypothetical protein [Puia sp.]
QINIKHDSTPSANLISHRAMNVFLSEAAGYYMSDPDNLTLYKNSVTVNAAEGLLAIYHNLRQPTGIDQPLRSFLSIGARANMADAYAAHSEGRPYHNQFGLLLKQTWIGHTTVTATPEQMKLMDTLRTAILHSTETAIRQQAGDFTFDPDLPLFFEFDYAHKQAGTLAKRFIYKVISFHWTSISLYVPLITANYQVAPDLGEPATTKHTYPLHFNITHTRLWEGSRFGRIYATLAGDASLSNSCDGYLLDKFGSLYTGDYKIFITPAVKGQLVWFPTNSHIGISFQLQQSIGDYHALDGILGIPVVLINKQAEAAVTFEFQVRFYDMGHSIDTGRGLNGRTAIGLTAGIPFSKIAF